MRLKNGESVNNITIILAITLTVLIGSLTLNAFLLKGYEFVPPATRDEQIAIARQIIAQDALSPTEKGKVKPHE